MPPKTKIKVTKETETIDIDGAMAGVENMGLNDVEVQQEEQKNRTGLDHWSDTSVNCAPFLNSLFLPN